MKFLITDEGMSEAFECDVCEELIAGKPQGSFLKGDGVERSRPDIGPTFSEEDNIGMYPWDSEEIQDLCENCKYQLDHWVEHGTMP